MSAEHSTARNLSLRLWWKECTTHPSGTSSFSHLFNVALEEEGICICAPVHDAILIEAPLNSIDQHVACATRLMQKASEWVLGLGRQCRVDAEFERHPDHYIDGRGADKWSFIQSRRGEEVS